MPGLLEVGLQQNVQMGLELLIYIPRGGGGGGRGGEYLSELELGIRAVCKQ